MKRRAVLGVSYTLLPIVAAAAGCLGERSAEVPRPHVVIVVSDTLRRDHLSLYGYERPTSPHLEAIAEDSVVFDQAIAPAPSTKASIATLFTGLHPSQHEMIGNFDRLPEEHTTLAEILSEAGYATGAFVENPVIGHKYGFAQGFEAWRADPTRHSRKRMSARDMNAFDERMADFVRERVAEDRPFFLYAHFIDPHSPYAAPDAYRRRFFQGEYERLPHLEVMKRANEFGPKLMQAAVDRYDEEILYVDARVGALVELLRELDQWDDTLFTFASDHGEGFGEHGRMHHSYGVYGELVNVPLLLHFPGGAAGRRSDPVQLADLLPTVLDVLELDAGTRAPLPGRSLRARPDPGRTVVSEHLRVPHEDSKWDWGHPQRALIGRDWKLIRWLTGEGGYDMLFDVAADPLDLDDRSIDEAAVAESLGRELDRWEEAVGAVARPERVELRPEDRAQLRALGYVRDEEEDEGRR